MRTCRGYSGWYNNTFLRSFLEFAYAYYLDNKQIKWRYETEIFDLDGISYKPDFYIIDSNDNVIKVVEIKGEGNRELGLSKVEKFREKYNYDIEILFYKDLVKLYKNEMPLRLNTAKKKWINEFGAKLNQKVDGEYNPMFGKKHSDKTRKIISEKAKERFKDEDYKKKLTENLIEYNRDNNFAHTRKPRSERETRICALDGCNIEFIITVKNKKNYCCHDHALKASSQSGADALKSKSRKELDKVELLILKWALDNRQEVLNIKLNKISEKLNPLYIEIEDKFNIKDKRTISKALFREGKSRKDFVLFLKEFVT